MVFWHDGKEQVVLYKFTVEKLKTLGGGSFLTACQKTQNLGFFVTKDSKLNQSLAFKGRESL